MQPLCLRTFLILIVLVVAVQLLVSLLSRWILRTALSAAITSRLKRCRLPRFMRRFCGTSRTALLTPASVHGALIFRQEPDRSGFDMGKLRNDLNQIHNTMCNLGVSVPGEMVNAPVPEVVINGPGVVGVIDSGGVLRTEAGVYDPLACQVKHNVSADPLNTAAEHVAEVIDMHRKRM